MHLPEMAAFFSSRGYTALTIDYRGFGDSDGPRWHLDPAAQVIDVRNTITYLAQRPEIDPDRIGLYGTSFGGAIVAQAAAEDVRARATVCSVGVGNGERWLRSLRRHWEWLEFQRRLETDRVRRVVTGESEWVAPEEIMVRDPVALEHERKMRAEFPERDFKLELSAADAIIQFKPELVVHRISPRAILFIGVTEDALVPTDETIAMYERAGQPKSITLMPPIGHHSVYYGDALKDVLAAAVDWYDEHLEVANGGK
jgi:dipeptidyl aminopeptidase/acylaminoacyl peptidase